jgi:putative salt-induced outer membrane protein
MEVSRFRLGGRDKKTKNNDNQMKIIQIAVAAVLLAVASTIQAQNVTTNIVTTTTTTISTTNNVTVTNTVTVTKTNVAPVVLVKPNPWKTSVAAGVTVARGNTDSTQISLTGQTQKKWTGNTITLEADMLYGESKIPNQSEQVTAQTYHGYAEYDRSFDRFYGYGKVDGFHDGIADIKYRFTGTLGLGYYVLTNKTYDLEAEVGPGFIDEQLGEEHERYWTLRLAEKAHYIISPNAKAWETVEFLPQVDDWNNYIINAEIGVEAKLTKGNKLSLRSVIDDSYVNVPAAGRLKNDIKFITSVVYNF